MTALEPLWGALSGVPVLVLLIGAGLAFLALGFLGAPLWAWTLAGALGLVGLGAPLWLLILFAIPAVVFNVPALRRSLVTLRVMKFMKAMKFLPVISETEKQAIEAGTVWIDGELFSGHPDWARVLAEPYPDLTPDERAFLDGPVEEVCRMTDDWAVNERRDLPPEVWDFLKRERFFGMIIPEQYGGLGFTASCNSAVVAKLATRCQALSISVMVPNSLGPAELLVHYGTEEQKDHYLPRLARGEDVPAFALTEPGAGSDAGAIQASGVVFKDADGELKLRLDWNKRYITLAAISTVLGLAFKLRDPEGHLGLGDDLGITCALIPTDLPGVVVGNRHDPLGVPFYNCPTQGHGVVVGLDAIIGGIEGAGQGWRMLMESLAAGRGISLPAASTGGLKATARVAGAYAAVRKQFGLSIGKFEGIEEPLARIGGKTYLIEAMRRTTCGALDSGAKPPVITAMAKLMSTELFRESINDGMDVVGGSGISLGPRNLLGHAYMGAPISITVEGANILTRTLMIFGQGAIRCHPYALDEITAMNDWDVAKFDRAFWGHIGHVVRNGCRAKVLWFTRGALASAPLDGPSAPYLKKLSWASASFAVLADTAMGLLGGDLKRRETVAGRFSDVFAWLYLASATVKRFEAEGRRAEDLPFFHWSMQYSLARIQEAFLGLLANLDLPGMGWLLRGPASFWWRLNPMGREPSDAVGQAVARAMQQPGGVRDSLTEGMYLPQTEGEALAGLERTFALCVEADGILGRVRKASRKGELSRGKPLQLLDEALEKGVVTADDLETVREAEVARDATIQVDDFSPAAYGGEPGIELTGTGEPKTGDRGPSAVSA